MKKKAIIIISLVIFILAALAGSLIYYLKFNKNMDDEDTLSKEEIQSQLDNMDVNSIPMYDLPKNIKASTKKYNIFENVYTSNKPVLLYGYEKGAKLENISENFHKNIQKEIKAKNFDKKYNIITISNPDRYVKRALINKGIDIEDNFETCADKNSELMDIIMTTADCYNGACIIDNKKHKYLIFQKKYPEFIIKALQDYNP